VNGFIMDIRHAAERQPKRSAFEQGLIPYIRQIVLTRNEPWRRRRSQSVRRRWNISHVGMGSGLLARGMRAFIEFDERGSGEFHFGYVHGYLDCRFTEPEGKPLVEWTWKAIDDMHDARAEAGPGSTKRTK